MFWLKPSFAKATEVKKNKKSGDSSAVREAEEKPCPNCKVSDETLRILKEKADKNNSEKSN